MLFLLVLDLIVQDMETGTCEFNSWSVFHNHFPILTPMIPLFTLKTTVNPKKKQPAKEAPSNSVVSPKKHRSRQEF